jgi:heterodisulfide reductase subunit B
MLAVFRALEIELEELPDWNCCGATAYASIDEKKAFGLAARNLALAEEHRAKSNDVSADLLAPCSACYLVLNKSQHYYQEYQEVKDEVGAGLKAAGLSYHGTTKVRHPLDFLVNDYGLDKLTKRVKKPLRGLKVASYYGCQIVRPFATFDDPFYPTSMDRLVKALGADPVDWPLKTRCCGGSLTGTIKEAGIRVTRCLLKEGERRNAQMMITCCPLCQFNLECYQDEINSTFGDSLDMPILYFTQLMGLALDLPEKELGIQRLFVKPKKAKAPEGGALVHA